ncbi:MAG: rhomboid family intramembrane serine protease [Atribacterota bacterium]|nr:rhomboid family intramembrane serine protease [Atribacterota bacterium]
MIPIRDELPTRRFPAVTVFIIGLNVAVFLFQTLFGASSDWFFFKTGLIPAFLWGRVKPLQGGINPLITLFTSQFVHGNFLHLFFNMLYLWIFGNNVEDTLGHLQFILFYLSCGAIASLIHAMVFPGSLVPTVGASGAIAGVMGGYLVFFPYARVVVMVFWGFFVQFLRVPALVLLGFWIILQVVYGLFSLAIPNYGGVAWFAHLGGFAVGVLWGKIASAYLYRKLYW